MFEDFGAIIIWTADETLCRVFDIPSQWQKKNTTEE